MNHKPTIIIAEAGVNHNGKMSIAKKLRVHLKWEASEWKLISKWNEAGHQN